MGRTSQYVLPFRPKLQAGEVFASYLARVAWANGFRSVEEFAKITGLGTSAVTKLSHTHAVEVSAWTEVPVDDLMKFSMRTETLIPFGACLVKRSQLQTNGVRYCPACIKNDQQIGVPHIRGAWHWRMLSHCPDHGCMLEVDKRGIMHSPNFDDLAHDSAGPIAPNELHSERYLMGRIQGNRGNTYLDQFPAYVAAEFCTLVGHFAHGLDNGGVKYRIPQGYENSTLRRLGYKIAREGVDAVWNLMTDYVRKASTRVITPSDIYSTVLHWASINKYDVAYTPLLRLFQDHAEANVSFQPGDTFIWSVKKRQVFTTATASREYGISEARVKRALKLALKLDELPRFLKLADIHAHLMEAASYVPTSEAASTIGCSLPVCDDIIKQHLLNVARNRDEEGRVYRLVHKNEISAFMRKLELVVDRGILPDELVPLDKAFRLARVGIARILELAFHKKIARIGCVGSKVDLGTLLFDPAEIRKAARELRSEMPGNEHDFEDDLIDLTAARRRLQVNKTTIEELVENGIIPSSGRADDSEKILVRPADLDAFAAEHVSAGQLAADRKITPQEILASLIGLGMQPALKTRFKADWFYNKSDIAALEYQ